MLSNMIRIVATGWCYYAIEGPKAKEWAHDVSGWLMMPLALALVGLELRLLSWLATESESDDEQVILPLLTDYRAVQENVKAGKDKRKGTDLDELE